VPDFDGLHDLQRRTGFDVRIAFGHLAQVVRDGRKSSPG
jgi:hypothetical protein